MIHKQTPKSISLCHSLFSAKSHFLMNEIEWIFSW